MEDTDLLLSEPGDQEYAALMLKWRNHTLDDDEEKDLLIRHLVLRKIVAERQLRQLRQDSDETAPRGRPCVEDE